MRKIRIRPLEGSQSSRIALLTAGSYGVHWNPISSAFNRVPLP